MQLPPNSYNHPPTKPPPQPPPPLPPDSYAICAKHQGGVARFINHSCNPNLYVQPLCVGHADRRMAGVALFAGMPIPAWTELTWVLGLYLWRACCVAFVSLRFDDGTVLTQPAATDPSVDAVAQS
jgi:hypothetical protein